MKKLFLLLAAVGMIFTACEKGNDEPNNNGDKPGNEQPGDTPDKTEYYIDLDQEALTISPDGGTVTVIVTTNSDWTLSMSSGSNWCTPSIKKGDANEEGQEISFSAEATYETRKATFTFKCKKDSKVSKKLEISQNQKDDIKSGDETSFDVPVEGGEVKLTYQTNVECKVVIPENAQSWISAPEATKALTSKEVTLTVSENTTYADRSAVVKVVAVENDKLFAEYTINQAENLGIVANEEDLTIDADPSGGQVELIFKSNVECSVIIPVAAEGWISLAEPTKALSDKKFILNIAQNRTGEARTAKITVATAENTGETVEYTINQESEVFEKSYLYYKSTDGDIVTPAADADFGEGTVVNNISGTITVDAPITKIGKEAFKGCATLEEITIPTTVTSIGDSAFVGCYAALVVWVESETPATLGATVFDATAKIYVPTSLLNVYKEAEGWKDYADQIYGYFGTDIEKPGKDE